MVATMNEFVIPLFVGLVVVLGLTIIIIFVDYLFRRFDEAFNAILIIGFAIIVVWGLGKVTIDMYTRILPKITAAIV